MKQYRVKYAYNHNTIATTMVVSANSEAEAEEKCFEYAGVSRVISVQEDTSRADEQAAADFAAAIKVLASKPENLENLENYLSQHFATWLEKYANTPENIVAELKAFSGMGA